MVSKGEYDQENNYMRANKEGPEKEKNHYFTMQQNINFKIGNPRDMKMLQMKTNPQNQKKHKRESLPINDEDILQKEREINFLKRELEFKEIENQQMKKNNQLLQENLTEFKLYSEKVLEKLFKCE